MHMCRTTDVIAKLACYIRSKEKIKNKLVKTHEEIKIARRPTKFFCDHNNNFIFIVNAF